LALLVSLRAKEVARKDAKSAKEDTKNEDGNKANPLLRRQREYDHPKTPGPHD
jgi:hypothetical protein